MRKVSIFAGLVLALTVAANAQVEGFGYDVQNSQIVGRLGLGGFNHLEVGLGLQWDNNNIPGATNSQEDDAQMTMSASVRYLLALHQWEKLTGFLHVGLYFADDQAHGSVANRRSTLSTFIGYEPELVLVPHLAVSTKFGLDIPIMPDFSLSTSGEQISIVQGFNFRILF
ncbi:MAG: hypothetical protein JWP91_274 [Fibrobacteres bacterium]|nr:hypothetical protein [Fibrobacterota bacterium]